MNDTPLNLPALAREIKDAQDRVAPLVPFTARHPDFDISTAYKVAAQVFEARRREGFVPIGRKIGFTNSNIWDEYGVREPIWGAMYDRTLIRLDADEGVCSLRRFAEPRIEPEIVFRLRAAPVANASMEELLQNIEWVAHGFEVVQSHFPDWKFKAADTVADGGLHGALLLGTPRPVESLGDNLVESLASLRVALSCNGKPRETGRGANVLGSPLAALAHLISLLASHGSAPLQVGEIVTTGTLTAAYPIAAGETWQTELQGIALPGLKVTFTA